MHWIIRLNCTLACFFAVPASPSPAADPPRIDVPALEKKIHELINEQRAKNSLPLLEWDERLAAIARAHSADMAEKQFFSHENPQGEDPEKRAARQGLVPGKDFTSIAENIFQMDRVRSVRTFVYENGQESEEIKYRGPREMAAVTVDGWMKSPGHRKNILTAELDREGIGVGISKEGLIYMTEVFIRSGAANVSTSK
jgi:uncharacterized protein YkwD